ncbi:ABC transporter permease [Mucilaginibacter gynuensis]|uniref:ABC transporter permease n=1 Tax=Mucilaginibacter gynuensis TaxID=1302236 RepID=A0ABP8H586_9SPHI
MFKNYLKIAFRNLQRNKGFSFINIAGLAVGMAGAILIFTWIKQQVSYDDFHANKNSLYKVWTNYDSDGVLYSSEISSSPIGAALKAKYPEVKDVARMYWPIERLFNYRDKAIKADGRDVDKPFLTMFSFPLISGNAEHALDDVDGVVISQSLAKKLFGDEDPMNKMVTLDVKGVYKVTGVMKDVPKNSVFSFDYLVSLAKGARYYSDQRWENGNYQTYLQLKPGVNEAAFNKKIKNLIKENAKDAKMEPFLHPLSKWRLYSRFENGIAVGGAIEVVRLVAIIAALILLIACINFMNLSTAQSEKRAKEVGVRRVIGAGKGMLIKQFLTESIVIAFIAGVFSLWLVQLCLPVFNKLTGESLIINYTDPVFIIGIIAFILFTGLLAGSYPAFFLSSFKPVKVLKGAFQQGKTVFTPRKVLVVVQFTVAIVLVISTIIVYNQVKFAQERDNGYAKNNLIDVAIEGDIRKNFDLIKNELISAGAATSVAKTSFSLTIQAASSTGYQWTGKPDGGPDISMNRFNSTGGLIKTAGLKLLAGRDIDVAEYPTDTASIIINETAQKIMKFKDAVGQTVHYGGDAFTIVGVFKDFIIGSPYGQTDPIIVHGSKTWNYNVLIHLNDHNSTAKNLALATGVFKKYNPAYPFNYKFVDQLYALKFTDEVRTATFAAIFAGLTIFISCLGLFGLAAYMAESRAKEIGIRKVLGASVRSVVQLLTKDFVVLVIIAIVIATPIGWWAMHSWLQNYQYRISLNWFTFAAAGLVAILIAVITVSMQAIKAALVNPVKSIKAE